MKRSLLAFAAIASLAVASPAIAAEYAVINVQKIMQDSKVATSVRNQLKAKQDAFKSELDAKEDALQKEDQELAKQRTVLSQEEFNAKYNAFRKKAAETQKDVQVRRRALDKGFANAFAQIQKTVTDIAAEVCKEKSYNMAISANHVLYADPALDITGDVLSRLDQRMPSINVQFN